MSTAKRQVSSLRDQHAAMTRRRIVEAFVETLEDEAADDVSMAAVAKRAEVAERTIYRHFKTRAEQGDRIWFSDGLDRIGASWFETALRTSSP